MSDKPVFGTSVIVCGDSIDFAIRTYAQHIETVGMIIDNVDGRTVKEEWHSLEELGLKLMYEDA